jgi:hypothetical protein
MKTTNFFIVLFAFVGLLFVSCSDEQQSPITPTDQGSLEKVIRTYFTSSDYPIQILDPGTVKVEGGHWIIRKIIVKERFNSDNSLVAGIMIHSLSATLDIINGEGLVWGSFTITPDENVEDGVWEGTYNGQRTRTGESEWEIPLDVVGHGKGGTLQSMQMRGLTVITAYDTPPTWWTGEGEGYIQSNGN